MPNVKGRLIFLAVLLVVFLSVYLTFYFVDRSKILQEAQANEWSDTRVNMLYFFSGVDRYYFVSYKDASGKVHKERKCVIHISELSWRDE